jgi:CheY-like chemotaxis protein
MSEETKARAFDPFFTTKPDGRGLGLATSYSIVQRHGGSIDLESEPGEGSVFHIWLPASPDTIVEAKPVDATQHTGAGTFIVMDDEEIVRIIADRTLDKLGYHVITVQDGQAAIDAFMAEREAGRHIAGMILDLTIPGGMGGKATVDAIRKVDQDVPVFVSTGYSDSPVVADPGAYGFTASIGKPFNKAELTEILDKYVKQEP